MTKLVAAYFSLLKMLIVLCLAGMCVMVFGNVVLRYLFNSGITVSEEVSRLLLVWLTFLGSIVVLRERGHIGVDTLVRRLPDAGRRICLVLSHLLMLFACWLMIEGSWKQTVINLPVASPAAGFPMGLFYAAGLLFGVSAAAILIWDLVALATGRISGEALIMVQESEENVEILAGHTAAPGLQAEAAAKAPPAAARR